jgi:hypothetical protein
MSLPKLLRGRLEKGGHPQSYRPQLEALETRDLLSVCAVDRLTDNNPGGGGDGGNGMGDLRYCAVDSLFRTDSINFSVTGTIILTAPLPTLTRNVSIEGPGANLVTVRRSSASTYAIFTVAGGVTASIFGLTISNGNNSGISNSGTLMVGNSTIAGNSGHYEGSGVSVGGGIYNSGTLTVSNSTISGNSSGGNGGGISNVGALVVSNSTISGNSAAVYGGGIFVGVRMATRNTIFAGNTAPFGPDIYGNMGSQGYNLLADFQDASGWTSTDVVHENPLLGPLQNNGGPTQTMALLARSPALDAGDPTQANTPDQRGVTRTGSVNIGAYQASAAAFLVGGFPSPITTGRSGSVTVTARDPYSNTAAGYRGTVHFTSSDGQAVLPPNYTYTAADNGVHTFTVTLNTPGTQSITVTDTSTPTLTGTQAGIQVTAPGVSSLQVAGFPSLVTAGVPGMVTVTARDALGNVVPSYRVTVHFTSSDS